MLFRSALRLAPLPGVRRIYPSQGNFLLGRFADADVAYARLLAAGVVVRDMRQMPQLGDALRITFGTPGQNDVVVRALQAERSEEHTSELQSLMRISYAVFCLKTKQ